MNSLSLFAWSFADKVNSKMAVGGIGIFLFCALIALAYFLPSAIAILRGHNNTLPIVAVNVLLGWSVVGYIIAFIWSLSSHTKSRDRELIRSRPPLA